MKQILTLVLALVVLGIMSISCSSKSSQRLQELNEVVQVRASLVDNNNTVLITCSKAIAKNYLKGDTVMVIIKPKVINFYQGVDDEGDDNNLKRAIIK